MKKSLLTRSTFVLALIAAGSAQAITLALFSTAFFYFNKTSFRKIKNIAKKGKEWNALILFMSQSVYSLALVIPRISNPSRKGVLR